MTDVKPPPMNPRDAMWVHIYHNTNQRVAKLPECWRMVMMGIRIYSHRVGFSLLLLQLKANGVAPVAERVKREIANREQFLAHMLAQFPPDEPIDMEETAREMAEELALLESPAGGLLLVRFLDRLLQRERTLKLNNGTVH